MLSSSAVPARRCRLLAFVWLALWLCAAAPALRAADATPQPPPPLVERGSAVLVVDGGSRPLPYAATAQGPLVALSAVAARLGGSLDVGPLGQSFTLRLGQSAAVLAPDSSAVTVGEEIDSLSQPPQVVDGELLVPIDLLERTYGTLLGVGFAWQPAGPRLAVSRPKAREIPVEPELVHLAGVSTLVFKFPETPRYRVRPREGGVDVELVGDRLLPPAQAIREGDPLVRSVAIGPERIRIDLAAGTRAEHYELREPYRLVFDLFRESGSVAAAAESAPRARELRTIVLDPGHGGKETGAKGPAGATEKELTLAIAQQLKARLEAQLPVKVILTRTEDLDLGLDERAAIANQNRADFFLSIHLNSSPRAGAFGAETYFLSLQASDQRAAAAAEVENRSDGGLATGDESADPTLQFILWDLAQSQHLAASQRVATIIQEELNNQLGLRDRGVKQAPFRVLMGAAMPAVLVELGFLSTAEEEKRLATAGYRGELAEALVRALTRFKLEYDTGRETAPAAATPAP